jgi:3-oxoacyl-(acyl-carrier-protein) synthase
MLSEGAALLMLEDAGMAAARGATVAAEVLGYSSLFAPAREESEAAAAVARTVRLALDDAGVAPDELDVLSASASGSIAVDRWEASGVAAALGPRAASLPVTAVKSMLGEAMGASGAFQAVALLGTLDDGALPGIRGLESTEPDFPLSAAVAETRTVAAQRALLTAVGADGHCCALVLGAYR